MAVALARPLSAAVLFLLRGCCSTSNIKSPALDCSREALNPVANTRLSLILKTCGAVLLHGVFQPKVLQALLESVEQMPGSQRRALQSHGELPGNRSEIHLPFEEPFWSFEFLGPGGEMHPLLTAVLGQGYRLVYLAVITVPPGGEMQPPHNDSAWPGSVTVSVPLHGLDDALGPVALCLRSHLHQGCQHRVIFSSSAQRKSLQRICDSCRWRQFELCVEQGPQLALTTERGKFGAVILRLSSPEAEALSWRVGDEIVSVNGQPVYSDQDWVKEVRNLTVLRCSGTADFFHVRVLRKRKKVPPLKLAVASPLRTGDVLLYNSQTVHWGGPNSGEQVRSVLYAGFMASEVSEDEDYAWSGKTRRAQVASRAFRQRHEELRKFWAGKVEL